MNKQDTAGRLLYLFLLGVLLEQPVVAEDQFGRLFTTPSQRTRLEELRKIEPEQRIKIDEKVLLIEEEVEETEDLPVDAITVRGLVYRSDGKSTAWINNSNTFEGGLSSQYINIGKIESNTVEIIMPTADTRVKLNVGQTFDPISESYTDLVEDSATTVINITDRSR